MLRELNGVVENHPEQTWAFRFKKLLLDMKKSKEEAMERTSADDSKVKYDDEEYGAIIKVAFAENPMVKNKRMDSTCVSERRYASAFFDNSSMEDAIFLIDPLRCCILNYFEA